MTDHNASTRKAQARTLETAVKHGEEWASHDVEIVAGFADETAEELARTLGRTVYAVQAIREALAKGEVDTAGRRLPKPAPASFFTFGAGWRD